MTINPDRIFIVVLTWNNYKDTNETLSSLLLSELLGAQILVVDNGSCDGSVEKLQKEYKQKNITFISNAENLGYVGGNNFGIKYALALGAEYVMLLNNDVKVAPDFFRELLQNIKIHKNVGIVAPIIFYYDHPSIVWSDAGKYNKFFAGVKIKGQNRLFDINDKKVREAQFVSGCCMLVRREVLEKIGLLDDDYYFYSEDLDFCLRAIEKGFNIIVVPESKIWHKIARGYGSSDDPRYLYYQIRNRLLLSKKHYGILHQIYTIIFTAFVYVPYRIFRLFRKRKTMRAFYYIMKAFGDYFIGKYGKMEQFR